MCVAITLAEEGVSTGKITKQLIFHHSTVSRVVKLKGKTGNTDRKNGSDRKRATKLAEDTYLKLLYQHNNHTRAMMSW